MNVFVTAGTGFIGNAVVAELVKGGHHVVALVRNPQKAESLVRLNVDLVVGDMEKPETYRSVVAEQDIDAVVQVAQLAVLGRMNKAKKARLDEADRLMTETLAEECLKTGAKLVYTSGVFVYGDQADRWITETTPVQPSPLGTGHQAVVDWLMRQHQTRNLNVTVLTPGFVYGPGGLFAQAFYEPLKKGQLRVFGRGQNYWSCVHVEDLARAYALAVEADKPGEQYNVADNEPLTLRALVDAITQKQGVKTVGSVPPWLVGLLIGFPIVDSLTTSFRVRNDKIKQELGWQPDHKTFREGVGEVLKTLNERSPTT